MPLKAVPAANMLVATATMSGPSGTQDNTSMAKSSKQSVEWYKEIIIQLIDNQAALKEQLNRQEYRAIKILLVKRFLGEVYKLKEFLTQIQIKIVNKRVGLLTVIK